MKWVNIDVNFVAPLNEIFHKFFVLAVLYILNSIVHELIFRFGNTESSLGQLHSLPAVTILF